MESNARTPTAANVSKGKGKERKGRERKGKERKRKERKGKEDLVRSKQTFRALDSLCQDQR